MKTPRHPINLLAFVFLLLPGLPAVAADNPVDASNDSLTRMAQYERQLEDLEFEFGPYHVSLLEPLASMIELARTQSDYTTVDTLQNRHLQVMRTELGFEHPDLIPQLREIIDTKLRLGDLEAVTDNLEHIRTITAANHGAPSEELLQLVREQKQWQMARVAFDENGRRARNFMASRELSDDMMTMAEELYGEDSPELVPWLYEHALTSYRLVEMLNAEDGLGSDTIDRIVREDGTVRLNLYSRRLPGFSSVTFGGASNYIPVVEAGELIGEAYLRDGFNLVKRLGRIAEDQDDLEAQAMALIYEGDFQMLMDLGTGYGDYRDAAAKLLESGIPQADIDRFFSRPAIIPASRIYTRFADALAALESSYQEVPTEDAGIHLGVFTAWDEALSATPMPELLDSGLQMTREHNRVDLSFTVNQRGNVSSVRVQDAMPPERSVERQGRRAVRELDLRPALIAGRGTRVRDVHIRYLYVPE